MGLEEVLRRSEIKKILRSPHSNESYSLRKGFQNYRVLFDESLGKKEKAERLRVSEGVVEKEILALKKYGISTLEEAEKLKTVLCL